MDATIGGELQRLDSVPVVGFHPPETPREAMEFLSRSWSDSAFQVSKALAPPSILFKTASGGDPIPEDINVEAKEADMVSRNPFCFASSATSHLVMERIMSQSEISPFESGRFSHSSSPLNGAQSCGSLTDSPPASPSEINDVKFCRSNNAVNAQNRGGGGGGGGKSVGRWLKDRKDKKKEEARGHNAQLHAAVSVAGVAAAVAAIAAATASSSSESGKDEQTVNTDTAVASAATLVAAQCVEAAEAMGAERKHLASVVRSAVDVQSAGDIMTLTAAAATALRGVATLKSRALKEVWNIAAVLPVERRMGMGGNTNNGHSNGNYSEELGPVENFLNSCNQELLARGCELLKRTRKGDLHWKVVFIYINQMGQVMLKMKSKHVAGTITKKKKYVVVEVCKDIPAWPGRQLLQGGEERQYFGLRTEMRGVIEFECRNQREYDVWTLGVSKLLSIVAERNDRHKN